MLARKWGTGLDKENFTLKYTTQDNVIPTLNPLTRRYKTYMIFQRICRINCRFYMDTTFSKDKSIVGNKYNQIFTDKEFVSIICLMSKSESGMIFYRINRDVGSANEISVDNVPY